MTKLSNWYSILVFIFHMMPSLDVAISNVGSSQNVSTSRPELKALSTSRSARELTYSQHSDGNE